MSIIIKDRFPKVLPSEDDSYCVVKSQNLNYLVPKMDAMGYSSVLKNALELECERVTVTFKGQEYKDCPLVDVSALFKEGSYTLDWGLSCLYHQVKAIENLEGVYKAADALNIPALAHYADSEVRELLKGVLTGLEDPTIKRQLALGFMGMELSIQIGRGADPEMEAMLYDLVHIYRTST